MEQLRRIVGLGLGLAVTLGLPGCTEHVAKQLCELQDGEALIFPTNGTDGLPPELVIRAISPERLITPSLLLYPADSDELVAGLLELEDSELGQVISFIPDFQLSGGSYEASLVDGDTLIAQTWHEVLSRANRPRHALER